MVHLARQLSATHIQEAMNTAAYRGHTHIVRLCYNYTKVYNEVMECAVGGYEEVGRLCRELEA